MSDEYKQRIIEVAKDMLKQIGFDAEVRFTENGTEDNKLATLAIESANDLGVLIGKNGQNLAALEHLLKVLVFKKLGSDYDTRTNGFTLDINDYRRSKANYISSLAKNVAQRVIQTQRAEALAPMTAYERRLVHVELASYKELQTESIGQEPRRRIVIKPTLPLD